MSTGTRVKEVRKTLGLTQPQFARPLGVRATAISLIENEDRALTEQMTKAICREYKVSYEWLKTGVGDDIFEKQDDDLITQIDNILMSENESAKAVFRAFTKLDDEEWKLLEKLIDKLAKK